jgi:hypothetical protein
VTASLVIGGVLLAAMFGAAGYAIRALPPDAGVPLQAGAPEYSLWLSKRAGLAAWLGIGAAAFAITAAVTASDLASDWATSVRVVLLPSVMCVAFAAEAGAIITSLRRCAPDALTPGLSRGHRREQPAAPAVGRGPRGDHQPGGEQ